MRLIIDYWFTQDWSASHPKAILPIELEMPRIDIKNDADSFEIPILTA